MSAASWMVRERRNSSRVRAMCTRLQVVTTVAETISAVAVVITLVIPIVSVRQSTAALEAAAAAESRDSLASMNDLDLTLGPVHFQLLLRSQAATTPGRLCGTVSG